MRQFSCIIIDDEELARKLLENFIDRLPNLNLIESYKSPLSALEVFQNQSIDIIFLDIQMPDMLGTEFMRSLNKRPKVIFTTAHSEHAVEGFELNAADYLLKPFSFNRFVFAVNKAIDLIEIEINMNTSFDSSKSRIQEYILVKADYKTYRIFFNDILYIQSMREYVAFYTPSGRILSLGSLKKLENELPQGLFLRIHNSYIISKAKVSILEGNMIHIGKEKIPIGASYREEVLKLLF